MPRGSWCGGVIVHIGSKRLEEALFEFLVEQNAAFELSDAFKIKRKGQMFFVEESLLFRKGFNL